MIIKIEAVPKLVVEDGVEKVVMGENNQPVWDKERALITTKGGNYRRIVTLTDELAAEVVKGHRYFNAVEKNGKLHITGRVSARFYTLEGRADGIFTNETGVAIRPEAEDAVQEFYRAGVKTVMITGDRIDTAFAIAKELHIASEENECISGEELMEMTDEMLAEKIKKVRVFAHVSPEHKVRIVAACKKNGEITAMTGDGVNDAPSLKAACVGYIRNV